MIFCLMIFYYDYYYYCEFDQQLRILIGSFNKLHILFTRSLQVRCYLEFVSYNSQRSATFWPVNETLIRDAFIVGRL